jgi:hypothetical protein
MPKYHRRFGRIQGVVPFALEAIVQKRGPAIRVTAAVSALEPVEIELADRAPMPRLQRLASKVG